MRTSASSSKDAKPFEFLEPPGGYSVGLKIVEQYDRSRVFRGRVDALGAPYKGERARPLQTLVWYPAEHTSEERMSVGDYVALWANEINFDQKEMPDRGREWVEGLASTLARRLWAVRDAPQASGRFPVVIYAPGCSCPSWENADLCEYLASHGYVVIASSSIGADDSEMSMDLTGASAQARDISFLMGYAAELPNADLTWIAVVGFSWGGLSNVIAAARDDRIRALVSLDGSILFSPGIVEQAGINVSHIEIPLLSICQGQRTPEEQDEFFARNPSFKGPNVLNAWTGADLISVRMLGLSHMEHSAMYQRNERIWWKLLNVYGQKKADYGRDCGALGYSWISRYTRAFLDAYLKSLPSAHDFLKSEPSANGAPRHFIDVVGRSKAKQPMTFDTFREQFVNESFGCIKKVYDAWCARDPHFQLPERLLLGWSDALIECDRVSEAIAVLDMAIQVYPESSTVSGRLGYAYERGGQRQMASVAYRRALRQCPDNADARYRMEKLEHQAI